MVNTEASQSRIQDADFAVESKLTKAQVLKAATSMLAQANASAICPKSSKAKTTMLTPSLLYAARVLLFLMN